MKVLPLPVAGLYKIIYDSASVLGGWSIAFKTLSNYGLALCIQGFVWDVLYFYDIFWG